MSWRFKIAFVPVCKIPAPDATSRRPDDRAEEDENESHFIAALNAMRAVDDIDHAEEEIIAAARSGLAKLHAVTWERVRDETSRNIHMLQLMNMAENGFPDTPQQMSPQFLGFWRFRDSLSAIDGVITYGNRTVIPPSLRSEVCQHLHSAHQGVTQMMSRATASIFWPGITTDIQEVRKQCRICDSISPSQPH